MTDASPVVAIVGARNFPNLALVQAYVAMLPVGTKVISGGAAGVDSAAANAARKRGLEVVELLPLLDGCKERYEFTKRYYERNQAIVDAVAGGRGGNSGPAGRIIAFTDKDAGGTWDTIKRARRAGLSVEIVKSGDACPACGRAFECLVGLVEGEEGDAGEGEELRSLKEAGIEAGRLTKFDPKVAVDQLVLPEVEEAADKPEENGATKSDRAVNASTPAGPGVHHIKRAGLGTFALSLRRKLTSSDYADIIIQKDERSSELAHRIAYDFQRFLKQYPIGHIDMITMPPAGDDDAQHVVRQAGGWLAHELGVSFVELFEARTRKKRGVHAEAPVPTFADGEDAPVVQGKMVLVIDDISTTGRTLKNSIDVLNRAGAHAQGLVWMAF